MKLLAAARSDRGLRREKNEDYFCADEKLGLLIVADGMGGHQAGDVASRMATELIRDAVERFRKGEVPLPPRVTTEADTRFLQATNCLIEAIRFANKVVFEESLTNPACGGMGTTVAAALVTGDRLSIAHLGDSRIYLVRGGCLEQLTDDHSLVEEQVREGLITREEADHSRIRNIITRSVGVTAEVEIDVSEMALSCGDRLILCTDGVTSLINEEEFRRTATEKGSPAMLCDRLVEMANDRGGTDNITVIAADLYRNALTGMLGRLFR